MRENCIIKHLDKLQSKCPVKLLQCNQLLHTKFQLHYVTENQGRENYIPFEHLIIVNAEFLTPKLERISFGIL